MYITILLTIRSGAYLLLWTIL